MLPIAPRFDFGFREAQIEGVYKFLRGLPMGHIRACCLLFNLPPARLGTKYDMLLPRCGNDCHVGSWQQCSHLPLVAFAERVPDACHNKMAIVAHALRLVFASASLEQFGGVVHTELARVAQDGAGSQLVMIGECVFDPPGKFNAHTRLPTHSTHARLRACH